MVTSSEMDKKVREAATELLDQRLIAELSEGDLVATESKYHKTCLAEFYSKARTFASKRQLQSKKNQLLKASLSQKLNVI